MVEDIGEKIINLTDKEYKELLERSGQGNFIEVNGIIVHSINESLKDIEDTVDRIIEKHGDFLLMKKRLTIGTGGIG